MKLPALAILVPFAAAAAQPKPGPVPVEALAQIPFISEPQISPDSRPAGSESRC